MVSVGASRAGFPHAPHPTENDLYVSPSLLRRHALVHLEPRSRALAGNHRFRGGLFLRHWAATPALPVGATSHLTPDRLLPAGHAHAGGRARLAAGFHWRPLPLQRAHDPAHAAGSPRAATLAAWDAGL